MSLSISSAHGCQKYLSSYESCTLGNTTSDASACVCQLRPSSKPRQWHLEEQQVVSRSLIYFISSYTSISKNTPSAHFRLLRLSRQLMAFIRNAISAQNYQRHSSSQGSTLFYVGSSTTPFKPQKWNLEEQCHSNGNISKITKLLTG